MAERIAFLHPQHADSIFIRLDYKTRVLEGKSWDKLTENEQSLLVVSQRLSSRVRTLMASDSRIEK